jgi:hypothetical protein
MVPLDTDFMSAGQVIDAVNPHPRRHVNLYNYNAWTLGLLATGGMRTAIVLMASQAVLRRLD